jgi:hypothetical protein
MSAADITAKIRPTYCNPEGNAKEASDETVTDIDRGRGRVQKFNRLLD